MRLSGVDPGIIRELSGIYKPFIKAFKELISNAYDADAKTITVKLAEDFSALEVNDDGIGMTPHQFHRDFARLGGSTAWLSGGKSPGGRLRIGYKGIGFLAVARYCRALHVETHASRPYKGSLVVSRRNRRTIAIDDFIGDLARPEQLDGRIRILSASVLLNRKWKPLKESRDFSFDRGGLRLLTPRSHGSELRISYSVDCRHLKLDAVLDFDYLLGLEHHADLRLLDDFCRVTLEPCDEREASFTKVRLEGLKDFVVRELSAPALKGKARNIVFKSGKEQFFWRLARSSPIRDDFRERPPTKAMELIREHQSKADLPTLIVQWRNEPPTPLARPVYLGLPERDALAETIPVDIDDHGLKIIGYLLARSEVIYPAEFRGISIRVRDVGIGDASFLGWEHILSGPRKAAMSQISGELLVIRGLDAADAINPGRESFYEESTHVRILKRELFGSGDTIAGFAGRAIRSILDRIHVRSQVTDKLTEARQRRKTLADISSAVSFYSKTSGAAGRGLSRFFDKRTHADGLSKARDVQLQPGPKLGGFDVEPSDALSTDFEIDFAQKRVRIDFRQDTWNSSVYLDGHYYDVVLKQGRPEHPICEFDNDKRKIFVNWAHPVKLHMNDVAFLKSAILLRLAHHAASEDPNCMMDLALNMLAFRAE